jgi:peptidoglycan/xylan/chitin deacetylase (PgdA/CDA1 family)
MIGHGTSPVPGGGTAPSTPIPILVYHSIDDHASEGFAPWAMSRRRFAEHMAHLADQGFRTLAVRDLVAALDGGRPLPDRTVVITFDDGFADFRRNALPELQRHGLAATLYVATGYIDGASRWLRRVGEGDRAMLTWPQLREVESCGIEVAAHSVTHPQLDLLRPAAARAEIVESKQSLQDGLGRPVDTFAYPFGNYDRRTREIVIDAGFTAACAVKHAMSHRDDDRFALARIIVRAGDGVADLKRYLDGENLALAPARERLRTAAWRRVRRIRETARHFSEIGHRDAARSA